ncbi:MAG: hypothetical protein K2X81_10860 [Candidatus Obscuribacterales bacterium]|jgi:hypothetical protein|nr:hypothetical protein [Candidatus Obscuribacterales bacterium]
MPKKKKQKSRSTETNYERTKQFELEEWKRLFKNAEDAQKSGRLRTAKSLYHKTLALAEKLDYEYQCKSLVAIKKTIIEIVSKEKAISLALADEVKALFDKAIKLRDASPANHNLGQKYTVPIYQLHVLVDVVRPSLQNISNLKDEVADMDYWKDIHGVL